MLHICNTNNKCECKCKHYQDFNRYIVLENFWVGNVELFKGQIIHGPVTHRWIDLGLVQHYDYCKQNKLKNIKEIMDKDLSNELSDKNALCSTDAISDELTTIKKTKKTRKKKSETSLNCENDLDNSNVVIEVPEKSEINLQEMIKQEVDSL